MSMLRENRHRKVISVVAKQFHGPLRPRDLDRADRCSSQGPDMTCSKERLLHGRYQVSFVPRIHPRLQRMRGRAHGSIARDRSDDDAKHAVSLSKSPQSDPRTGGGQVAERGRRGYAQAAQRVLLQESNDAGNSGSARGDLV
jgi:hypothetical protein